MDETEKEEKMVVSNIEKDLIRPMRAGDWGRVSEIYLQGIETGIATFNTECPSYEEWDRSHVEECRFVYETAGEVIGWVAASPISGRCAYRGCVEMSIYVDAAFRGKGVGSSLMKQMIGELEKAGYWSIYSAIISINEGSIRLHKKCGFREIGYRERIAKDRFGKWQNTTLMEYRM